MDGSAVHADLMESNVTRPVWMLYHQHPYEADTRMEFVLEHEDVQILALIRLSVRRLSKFSFSFDDQRNTSMEEKNVFRWKDMIIRIILRAFSSYEPRGDTMIECETAFAM